MSIRRVNSAQVSPSVSHVPVSRIQPPSTPTARVGSISRLARPPRSGSITRISPVTPSRLSPSHRPFSETPNRSFFLPLDFAPPVPARPPSSRGRLPLRENFALLKAELLSAKRRSFAGSGVGDDLRRLVHRGRVELAEISSRGIYV
jgi:hypothetical protein